ncbi:trypsin I-P1 [Drosophila ficusphila]|uniref:trypsin I-P1 n=1 Tax=Drosophila ficusphila TaxID=30025 RepID=UPI0007E7D515|nr:trypsin I-P1 [Drosophila ficusphila]
MSSLLFGCGIVGACVNLPQSMKDHQWMFLQILMSLALEFYPGNTTQTRPLTASSTSFVILPKVVGGYSVTIDQVPFQVSVRRRSIHERHYGKGHLCGGAIISQRVVCSAAHCYAINSSIPLLYRDPDLYVVVAGSSTIDRADRFTQEYLVQRIIGHEWYNRSTLENDIALLFLNGFIPWKSQAVRAIPLSIKAPEEGTTCLIHGWGKVSQKDKSASLQQAPIPILSKELCQVIYKLPASQMCAGFLQGGIDACQGDSGGPLICDEHLAGIISWGVGCADPGYPGVYTNVTHFLEWIRAANSSLDYSEYRQIPALNSAGLKSISAQLLHLGLLVLIVDLFWRLDCK